MLANATHCRTGIAALRAAATDGAVMNDGGGTLPIELS